MGLFGCHHQWEVESTNYVPRSVTKMTGGTPDIARQLMGGFTAVYLRCRHCGDLSERIVTGKYEPRKQIDYDAQMFADYMNHGHFKPGTQEWVQDKP